MDEVASMSIGAVPLVQVAETRLGFVGSVLKSVATQLLRPMCELATLSVRTKAVEHKILAKRTLNFVGSGNVVSFLLKGMFVEPLNVLFLGFGVGVGLVGGGREVRGVLLLLRGDHVRGIIIIELLLYFSFL